MRGPHVIIVSAYFRKVDPIRSDTDIQNIVPIYG